MAARVDCALLEFNISFFGTLCDVAAASHVAEVSHWCPTPMSGSQVISEVVYKGPIVPVGNRSCFHPKQRHYFTHHHKGKVLIARKINLIVEQGRLYLEFHQP